MGEYLCFLSPPTVLLEINNGSSHSTPSPAGPASAVSVRTMTAIQLGQVGCMLQQLSV